MIRILVFILGILALTGVASTGVPVLRQQGKTLDSLVPKGWKVLKKVRGDLNRDRRKDLVFVLQGTDPAMIKANREGLGDDVVDLNPRILAIYFRSRKTGLYYKKRQLNSFILIKDQPTMEEPLAALKISRRGVLHIGFQHWFSAGSWSSSEYSYKFRYRRKRFGLVGYETSEMHRGSGESTHTSINFLRKRMVTTKSILAKDRPLSVRRKKFRLRRLKTLRSFLKPFQWHFMGVKI